MNLWLNMVVSTHGVWQQTRQCSFPAVELSELMHKHPHKHVAGSLRPHMQDNIYICRLGTGNWQHATALRFA